MRISTQVSKTNPLVKKILNATGKREGSVRFWKGRIVHVVQVDPSWSYTLYGDTGEPYVFYVEDLYKHPYVEPVPGPSYGTSSREVTAPQRGGMGYKVVVTRERGTYGAVMIYVPVFDPHALDVARDALLSGDKKNALKILKDNFDDLAPLALAVLEAQRGTFEKIEKGKTSRQLDREIAEFMKGRS